MLCDTTAINRGGELQKALELLTTMQDKGLQPSVDAYTSLLHACGRCVLTM
jgi:pentatricopeptide repeat protein